TTIFRANSRKFEIVAENHLGHEGYATIAISNGQIFLRTAEDLNGRRQEFLYCLGATPAF
ncbi:MAG: hypothetical protein B7Z55_05095, partial [Planctomycetales bacterium 12-60-4]